MKLTRNFSLSELIKSDTAIRLGIDNNPNADQMEKLKLLCENILHICTVSRYVFLLSMIKTIKKIVINLYGFRQQKLRHWNSYRKL